MLTALPLPSTAPSREVSPEPMLPSLGTESLGKHTMTPSIVGHFVGAPALISFHGIARNLVDACKNNGSWQIEFTPCSAQVLIPTRVLLICRTKLGAHSDQGTWRGADLSDSDFKQGVLLALDPGLPMPGQAAES